MQGYTLSCQLIVGREECRGTLFLSSISNSRESNSVGVHSFLPVSKQGGKSAGVHSFLIAVWMHCFILGSWLAILLQCLCA